MAKQDSKTPDFSHITFINGEIKGAKNADEIEQYWYYKIYQGENVPQLSVRSVIMGSFLGGFMSLSNLYVGLKTGWALGVAITSCILSFTIYKSLMRVFPGLFKTEMSVLENNCMQSTASAAGYSTGSMMVSGVAAYLMITGHHMAWPLLTLWTFFLASLGIFMAVPMKRQMINVEQLRFPSGIAAAETLKSLHSAGKEAALKARSLGISGVLGGLIAWFRDAGKPFSIPGQLHIPGSINGFAFEKWTISFELSTIMIAAGAIMGWKITWSMMLGAVIDYGFLAPKMVQIGAIDASKLGYRAIMQWATWAGASMMVTSGLFQFALQWKTIARAFTGMSFGGKKASKKDDKLAAIEVPNSWLVAGFLFSGIGCISILYFGFGTSLWMGIVAVLMSFFLALVAARATGESDITPIGAMGKITQLTFGILAPSNITTNLMTASVTSGAASSAADLLTDLKSGYLLGANPRKQFIAQYLGLFAGVAVVVPAFYLLVPTAESLGTDQWPAPSAQVWAAVARLLANGFEALHPAAQAGFVIGGIIGVVLPALEAIFPKQAKYIPSAMGIGLAMVIPFFNTLSMFIGAVIGMAMEKFAKNKSDLYLIPVSSGFIAGESIMGIIVALLSATGKI